MNRKIKLKKVIVTGICYAQALLFIYAATSKLLDFENFQVQLGQSPLVSAYAGWIAILVPATEIVFAIALTFPKTQLIALYGSYVLMVMFSAYIYIILNYSEFIPCSCGGVLEKMTWNQHLIFNLLFVFAGAIAIILHYNAKASETNHIL